MLKDYKKFEISDLGEILQINEIIKGNEGESSKAKFYIEQTKEARIDLNTPFAIRGGKRKTLLDFAIEHNRPDIKDILIKNGASLGAIDPENLKTLLDGDLKPGNDNQALILEAARYARIENIELLHAKGWNPMARSEEGATALHWAAYGSATPKNLQPPAIETSQEDIKQTFDFFIKKGVDVYGVDNLGNTIAHYVESADNTKTRQHIKEIIGDKLANQKDKADITPADLARTNEDLKEIAKAEGRVFRKKMLHGAMTSKGNKKVVAKLPNRGLGPQKGANIGM